MHYFCYLSFMRTTPTPDDIRYLSYGAVLLSFVRLVFRTAAPVARRPANAPTVIVSIQPKVMNVHA